jgi:hypothetical protein
VTRIANRWTALAIGGLVLAMFIASAPVSHLAGTGGWGWLVDPLALAFAPVGLVIAVKRPGNPIGWTLLIAGLFAELDAFGSLYVQAVYREHHALPLGPLAVLLQPSWAPAIVLFGVAIQLFPSGAVPTGRWAVAFWAYVALGAAWAGAALAISLWAIVSSDVHVTKGGDLVQLDHPHGVYAFWGDLQNAFFFGLGLMIVAWLARELPGYRRATGERRQQLKWLMGGAIAAGIGGFFAIGLSSATGVLGVVGDIGLLGVMALPVSLGIAVLKFRLYEIDRLVSRTITYTLVTGSLVAVFLGLIVLTTRVLPFSSPVGVAASTLAAAALFNPLRVRVQRVVDRRFNRARYSAQLTVEALGLRLRDALDVDAVEAGLAEAIASAFEPTSVAVWTRSGT